MLLSDSVIRARMQETRRDRRIVIEPTPMPNCFQPASVDLTLGRKLHLTKYDTELQYFDLAIGYYFLEPGDFVLGCTREHIEVPETLAARVEGKSTWGRRGLVVHVTAGFIDPGFRGNVTLELKNVSHNSIKLEAGVAISQICFIPMLGKVERPYGTPSLRSKYQDSKGTVDPK